MCDKKNSYIDVILNAYHECNYGSECSLCPASTIIPTTDISWCQFLLKHRRYAEEKITEAIEKYL